MKYIKYTFYLALLLTINSCKKDTDTGSINIRVNTSFENQELELYTEYDNIDGYGISVEDFKLYLSNISVRSNVGEDVLLSDVAFFNKSDNRMSVSFEIPTGTYMGFKYGLGVDPSMNGIVNPDFEASMYEAGHPLNLDNGMYWSWATGYRFMIFDGRADTLPNVTGNIPIGFSIHTGKDQYYKSFDVNMPFSIKDGETSNININFDISRLMYNETDTLHFNRPEDRQMHGENDVLAGRFDTLIEGAISHNVD